LPLLPGLDVVVDVVVVAAAVEIVACLLGWQKLVGRVAEPEELPV